MKWTPSKLIDEIKAARSVRDAHLRDHDAMVSRMCQDRGEDDPGSGGKWQPENHEHEYLSLVVPKICFTAPRVRVQCWRPFEGKKTAKALLFALNQWGDMQQVGETGGEVARDMLLNWGVFYTTIDKNPWCYGDDDEDMPRLPTTVRLSQKQFFMDPLCAIFRHARYAGHDYGVEKDELIEQAEAKPELGWDAAMLEELSASDDFEWEEDSGEEGSVSRERLRISEVWCPGVYEEGQPGPDQGCHGTIYTVCDAQAGRTGDDWIRKPRSYFGPKCGPYGLAGAYTVPDSPWPLGPLAAVKGKVDELNAHASAASKAMAEYKRLVLCDAANPQLPELLKKPDMFVIPVAGFKADEVVTIEIGGLTPQHLTMLETLRERLDRGSSMGDAQRGNAKSGVTATADAIADQSGTVRMAHLKQRFGACMRQVYETAMYYMLTDDRVVFPLGEDFIAEHAQDYAAAGIPPGQEDPFFVGGLEASNPSDYMVQLEPYSMDFVGEAVMRQQFAEGLQLFLGLVQSMPTMPHVKWRDVLDKLGDVYNDDWGDMVDTDLAAMMGGLPMGQPATPSPGLAGQSQKIGPGGTPSTPQRALPPGRSASGPQQGAMYGAQTAGAMVSQGSAA